MQETFSYPAESPNELGNVFGHVSDMNAGVRMTYGEMETEIGVFYCHCYSKFQAPAILFLCCFSFPRMSDINMDMEMRVIMRAILFFHKEKKGDERRKKEY